MDRSHNRSHNIVCLGCLALYGQVYLFKGPIPALVAFIVPRLDLQGLPARLFLSRYTTDNHHVNQSNKFEALSTQVLSGLYMNKVY